MRYAVARYSQNQRELAYRIYVTDCLRILTENTAKVSGGSYMDKRYYEVVYKNAEDQRSGEEIVAYVVRKTGIGVVS